MHGPALVRNPKLADYFLSRKLGTLAEIDDEVFRELHVSCVERAVKLRDTRGHSGTDELLLLTS
jgi:CobQ-like glutamine amidotransferase family enzyme